MKEYGSQSMIAPLRKVLVKRPGRAFAGADPARWHYAARPDLEAARREHDAFVQILRDAGAEVFYHDEPQPERADAIYVYDPAIVTDRGAIVLRPDEAVDIDDSVDLQLAEAIMRLRREATVGCDR